MAIRSSAGTGVIVSLVVFVLATVFLLVLSIVFYASGRAQKEETGNLVKAFDVYATKNERSNDTIADLVAKADSSSQSVVSYLYSELEERNRILTGNKNAELAEITTVFRETTSANSSLALTVGTLNRGLASRQAEVDSYLSELASAKSAIKSLEDQLIWLLEVSRQMLATRDLTQLLTLVADSFLHVTNTSRSFVMLRDRKTGVLVQRVGRDAEAVNVEHSDNLVASVNTRVFNEGKGVFETNTQNHQNPSLEYQCMHHSIDVHLLIYSHYRPLPNRHFELIRHPRQYLL